MGLIRISGSCKPHWWKSTNQNTDGFPMTRENAHVNKEIYTPTKLQPDLVAVKRKERRTEMILHQCKN